MAEIKAGVGVGLDMGVGFTGLLVEVSVMQIFCGQGVDWLC